MSKYIIVREKIKQLVGDEIFTELIGHLPLTQENILFPDVFIVIIDLENQDDDGIKYYKKETDLEPFLIMGIYNNGFYTTAAMFKSIGNLVN